MVGTSARLLQAGFNVLGMGVHLIHFLPFGVVGIH